MNENKIKIVLVKENGIASRDWCVYFTYFCEMKILFSFK